MSVYGRIELRMSCRADPACDDCCEFIGRVAGVRGRHHFEQSPLAGCSNGRHVALEHAFEGLPFSPLGVLWRERLDPVEGESDLKVDWLFRPERAVVVERGDPLGDGHEVRSAFPRHATDEVENRVLRRDVVPRRKLIGGRPSPRGCRSAWRRSPWCFGATGRRDDHHE